MKTMVVIIVCPDDEMPDVERDVQHMLEYPTSSMPLHSWEIRDSHKCEEKWYKRYRKEMDG